MISTAQKSSISTKWTNVSSCTRRLRREYADVVASPVPNCTAGPIGDDLFEWTCIVVGPEETPYAGGHFSLAITIPPEYPFKPPKVLFTTKIYHCNINALGEICLDILKDNWTPALTISKVVLSISSLLTDANPNDPLVSEIAQHLLHDRKEHDRFALEWTTRYASPTRLLDN